jgi:hypothetical protein
VLPVPAQQQVHCTFSRYFNPSQRMGLSFVLGMRWVNCCNGLNCAWQHLQRNGVDIPLVETPETKKQHRGFSCYVAFSSNVMSCVPGEVRPHAVASELFVCWGRWGRELVLWVCQIRPSNVQP